MFARACGDYRRNRSPVVAALEFRLVTQPSVRVSSTGGDSMLPIQGGHGWKITIPLSLTGLTSELLYFLSACQVQLLDA